MTLLDEMVDVITRAVPHSTVYGWAGFNTALVALNVLLAMLLVTKTKQWKESEPEHIAQRRSLRTAEQERNVLLVTAHPDDESMFFAPSVAKLHESGKSVFVLCLCNGNFEGLGELREKELYESCAVLGVPRGRVNIIHDDELQDGPGEQWSSSLVAAYVAQEVNEKQIGTIISFDDYGVSGHPNHIAVARGVREYIRTVFTCTKRRSESLSDVRLDVYEESESEEPSPLPSDVVLAYELESTNIVRKYIGVLDIVFSASSRLCFVNFSPGTVYRAMAAHASQFVWYRKLFVVFSRYSSINTLNLID